MHWLILAIAVTLTVSFVCSLFEALVLSSTVAEIEALKKSHPRSGQRLELIKHEIDETISAILTLNTIANGLGSVVIGALGAHLLQDDRKLALLTIAFGAVLLVGAEVLPKNIGVVYRRALQPYVVWPLWTLRRTLRPITWTCNVIVRWIVPRALAVTAPTRKSCFWRSGAPGTARSLRANPASSPTRFHSTTFESAS
jgi:Mg2+/Co2+ transporter CorB